MTNANMISHLSWSTISYDWEWRDQGGLERQDVQARAHCLSTASPAHPDVQAPVQTRNGIGCDEHGQCRDTSFIIAQTTGQQAGTVPIAIDSGLRGPNCTQRPDLNSSQSGGCIQWLTRTHFATCLVHEVRPQGFCGGPGVPASPDGAFEEVEPACNVSSIMLEFGYGSAYCDHYRFWEDLGDVLRWTATPLFNRTSPTFQGNATMVLPLLVRCPLDPDRSHSQFGVVEPSRLMIIFSSFGPAATVNFELNRTMLGVRDAAAAIDAETRAEVPRVPVGPAYGAHHNLGPQLSDNFTFRLDRHNFRVVVVE